MPQFQLPGAQFVEGNLTVDGYDILYASAGKGPVLVCLPGSAGIEMSVGKDLLAQYFWVVEINPPGWGPKDDLQGRMDQKDLANLLIKVIDALDVAHFHLIGTSMGGINALWIAIQHPDRVKSLILDASMTFMAPEFSHNPEADGMIAALQAGKVPPEKVAHIVDHLPPAPVYPAKPWMDQAYFRTLMANRFRMFPHFSNDFEAELNQRAATVACPVMALLGAEDEILKREIAQNYALYMPQARFKLIDSGSHDLQGSHPQKFANTVRAFIEDVEDKLT